MSRDSALRPACFVDRDGTLTEDRGYAATADDVVLLPGAAAAVRRLNQAGVPAVVISNQSGVGRGYFDERALAAQHQRLGELLREAAAAYLDGIYHCPHAPAAACACRKPATGLIERAAREPGLDAGRSWMIGDRAADLECGRRATRGGLLVLTGEGRTTLAAPGRRPPPERVFADLGTAVDWVLAELAGAAGEAV